MTLDAAWDLFTDLGAHAPALRVQRALQAVGVRRRRWGTLPARPVVGWPSLTPTEERVARIIAAGHTNRSAADQLGISPNTVATHVRSVFQKLEVSSRVQLSLVVPTETYLES